MPPQFKLIKGDSCFVHALSPVLENYFNKHGQPLPDELINSSCFEGVVVRGQIHGKKGQGSSTDNCWIIEIGALDKDGKQFYANLFQLNNQYFVKDIMEPEGWVIQSRLEMDTLYNNQVASDVTQLIPLARGANLPTPPALLSISSIRNDIINVPLPTAEQIADTNDVDNTQLDGKLIVIYESYLCIDYLNVSVNNVAHLKVLKCSMNPIMIMMTTTISTETWTAIMNHVDGKH
jgi:hypothetical protein